MCVCLCVCVCLCLCVCVCACVCVHVCICVCVCVCVIERERERQLESSICHASYHSRATTALTGRGRKVTKVCHTHTQSEGLPHTRTHTYTLSENPPPFTNLIDTPLCSDTHGQAKTLTSDRTMAKIKIRPSVQVGTLASGMTSQHDCFPMTSDPSAGHPSH